MIDETVAFFNGCAVLLVVILLWRIGSAGFAAARASRSLEAAIHKLIHKEGEVMASWAENIEVIKQIKTVEESAVQAIHDLIARFEAAGTPTPEQQQVIDDAKAQADAVAAAIAEVPPATP